ncbi:hypothetical protein Moror_7036 [Moniliophthora roreri MCA 2997]|uniref:F-box domain-containing protein n=2 Tax=Moniliophthora roreri TaxID=221103 RepID=V2XBF3_MONRO|nr:hypothetical protein Moror_7036 [Moniliophthora roreri MCA 2997]KAI3619564.1 hypothetical protein WG66_002866 [Moniliophthora roreri]
MQPQTGDAQKAEETEELRQFREAWKAEVKKKKLEGKQAQPAQVPTSDAVPSSSSAPLRPAVAPPSDPLSIPEDVTPPKVDVSDARQLSKEVTSPAVSIYRQAVLHEQRGELDEALLLYRQAFRRDPNVDRAYHQEERLGAFVVQVAQQSQLLGKGKVAETSKEEHHRDLTAVAVEALSEKVKHTLSFQDKAAVAAESGKGTSTTRLASLLSEFPQQLVFEPEDEKEPVLLNMLPDEMIVSIIKRMDPSSIERFAAVNRKARLISLDATIWRELVDATYKPPQIQDENVLKALYDQYLYDYRRLYIEHPRVRMDGVYIAVCHYVRPGLSENQWVNLSHLITYHRYLRFYPNGQVLSLLTNEEQPPAEAINKLKLTSRSMKGLFIGTWHLSGTTIVISNLLDTGCISSSVISSIDFSSPSTILDAINRLNSAPQTTRHNEPSTQQSLRYMFTMSLSLRSRPLGRWNKLDIVSYDSISLETGDTYPVALKRERPFWFSKVRSYAVV